MLIEGLYNQVTQVLTVSKVRTDPSVLQEVDVTVACSHGKIDLPLRHIEYAANSTSSARKLTGSMREINFALRHIVYTPNWAAG